MEQHGISFEYQVKLGNDCFAEKSDLCRILANLLDNAIEACQTISLQQKETSENRWNRNNLKIRLTCMPLKNMLFIQTENPFIGSLSFRENGLPFSVKKDPTHGRGLAGLKKIADKYKGTVRFETNRSGRCIVTVTLLNLFES